MSDEKKNVICSETEIFYDGRDRYDIYVHGKIIRGIDSEIR